QPRRPNPRSPRSADRAPIARGRTAGGDPRHPPPRGLFPTREGNPGARRAPPPAAPPRERPATAGPPAPPLRPPVRAPDRRATACRRTHSPEAPAAAPRSRRPARDCARPRARSGARETSQAAAARTARRARTARAAPTPRRPAAPAAANAASVASRPRPHTPPRERLARPRESRLDLGGVVRVVVHHHHASHFTHPLEAAPHSGEFRERRERPLEIRPQLVHHRERRGRIAHVVESRHA